MYAPSINNCQMLITGETPINLSPLTVLRNTSSRHQSRQTHHPQPSCGSGTVDPQIFQKTQKHHRFHIALPLIIVMGGICLRQHISSSCCGHYSNSVQTVYLRLRTVHLGGMTPDLPQRRSDQPGERMRHPR